MTNSFKGSLVVFIALIYLVFACSYVILCSRNTTVVNIFKSKHSISLSKGNIADKTIGKFLSRPRVIMKRINSLLIIAVMLISFFTAYSSSNNYPNNHFSLHYFVSSVSGVVFLRKLRC